MAFLALFLVHNFEGLKRIKAGRIDSSSEISETVR
jgi:hypothetical protein